MHVLQYVWNMSSMYWKDPMKVLRAVEHFHPLTDMSMAGKQLSSKACQFVKNIF